MRLKQDDRESGCVPKNSHHLLPSRSDFHHGNRYDCVSKTTRDVEFENDIVWKLVVSRPRFAFSDTLDESFFFDTLDESFLENFESHRRVRRSAARRCNVVRTETGNCFCVRICYKFLISDCRGEWDVVLCTFWVLAKREPLSKSYFRKKRVSPAENMGFCLRATDL